MKQQMLKEYARKRNVAAVRRLTQEELLEEAKITEEINMHSLGKICLDAFRVFSKSVLVVSMESRGCTFQRCLRRWSSRRRKLAA